MIKAGDLGPALAALRAARTTDGMLTIANDGYGASIAALLNVWFPGGKTVLTGTTEPALSADHTQIVFAGQLGLFAGAVHDDACAVTLQYVGADLEISLDLAMPTDYTLGASFPIYAVGLVAEVPLDDVHWLLRSDGGAAARAALQVSGLNVRATIAVGRLIPALALVLGDVPLTMTGPVAVTADGIPQLLLRRQLADLAITKGLSLPLALSWSTAVVNPGVTAWATCSFGFMTEIDFKVAGAPQSLTLACDWNLGATGLVEFSIASSFVPVACAIEDLATLLLPNQFDFAGAFPKAYQPNPGFALYGTSLVLQFAPTSVSLLELSVGVICDAQWSVFKDFSVDQITARLTVTDPFHHGAVRCTIGSVCDVAGGKVDLSAVLSSQRPVFAGALEDGSSIDLGRFVTDLFPSAVVPALTLDQFDFTIVPGESYSALARFVDDLVVSLGPLTVALPNVRLAGGYGPRPTNGVGAYGTIAAEFLLSSARFDVAYDLSGDFRFAGAIPEVSIAGLLADLSWTWPAALPDLAATDVALWFDRDPQNNYRLAFGGDVDGLGRIELLVDRASDGTWGFGGGFVHTGGVDLAAITWMPQPLKAIKFKELALLAATFTDPKFQIPGVTFPGAPAGITAGVLLYASLALDELGLGTLGKSLRIPDLAVYADLAVQSEALTIGAGIASPITLCSFATIPTFGLSLTAGGGVLDVALKMGVQFVIHDQTLLFTGALTLAIDPPTAALSLLYTGDWNPFGSIVVTSAGVQVDLDEAGAAFAIAGSVAFSPTVSLALGCEVVLTDSGVPVPDYLSGTLTGAVSLSELVGLAVPGGIPPAVASLLAVTVSDFDLYLVLNPLGVMLFGQLYPPGFASQGTLQAYGMTVAYKLKLDPYHLACDVDGSVSGVDLDGVVTITEAAVAIDFAAANPLATTFSVKGAAHVLGAPVDLTVLATASPPQFTFSFHGSLWSLGTASVVATAGLGSLSDAGFTVTATMWSDFLNWLGDQLSHAVRDATSSAQDQLQKAIDAVASAQRAVDNIPDHWWDWPAKKTAEAALKLAEDFLRGLQAELGAVGIVAGWIIDHGSTAVVSVNAASFSGALSVVNGGSVQLALSGTVVGQGFNLPPVGFAFPSPADAIKRIADQLIHLV